MVIELNVTLTALDLDAVKPIIEQLRPEWKLDEISVKTFTEGISNATKAFYVGGKLSTATCLVIRLNGQGTDDFLDRQHELDAYERLSAGHICPPLVAKFNNGIVMSLVEGVVFTGASVKEEHNAHLTSREIARMHRNVPLRSNERESSLVDSVKHFLRLVQHHTIERVNDKFELRKLTEPSNAPINAFFEPDFAFASELIGRQTTPLVVAHNDLLLANFLLDEPNDKVTIIDYEYLAPNPAAFDLANHFNEYAGTEVFDFTNIPNEEYQKRWLRTYLAEYLECNDITQATIDQWHASVELMAPLSHLLWGTWALMQMEKSSIDFDYASYAMDRLRCYFELKGALIQPPVHSR